MGKVYDVTVTFERKISPKDYESAGAKVELRAQVLESENEDEVLDRVSALAVSKAYSMLGVKAPNAPAARPAAAKELNGLEVASELVGAVLAKTVDVAEESPAPKRRGRPAGTTAAEMAARAKAEAQDPTDMDLDEEAYAKADAEAVQQTAEVLAAFDEVTDADLNAAMQKKNAELNDPARLRAIVAGYNPDPLKSFTLREIPQAKRAEFLAKVAALKPLPKPEQA